MARKLNTKVIMVDNKWSVVVTDNEQSFLFYSSELGLHTAQQVEKTLRQDIHKQQLNISHFNTDPIVYKRLSNRKKIVYTITEPVNENS